MTNLKIPIKGLQRLKIGIFYMCKKKYIYTFIFSHQGWEGKSAGVAILAFLLFYDKFIHQDCMDSMIRPQLPYNGFYDVF